MGSVTSSVGASPFSSSPATSPCPPSHVVVPDAVRSWRMPRHERRARRPPSAGWDPSALIRRVEARIHQRHLSPKTEKTYVGWIKRYLAHYGRRDPAALGRSDIEAFLQYLAERRGLGAQSQNQAASAIAFLYREVFGVDVGSAREVARAKEQRVLPRYASPEEVDRLLTQLRGRARVAAIIMYGSGTRVAETASLRIKDIHLGNRELTVRAGKGKKDRITIVPDGAVPILRRQIEAVEALHVQDLEQGRGWARLPGSMHRKDPRAGWELGWQFLFPSRRESRDPKTEHWGRLPVHVTTIQRAVKAAARSAGLQKPITCHVLRHCFATEMLRNGCEIRTLQRLMGHNDLKTTARYLHILDRPGVHVISPFDRLPSVERAKLLKGVEGEARQTR